MIGLTAAIGTPRARAARSRSAHPGHVEDRPDRDQRVRRRDDDRLGPVDRRDDLGRRLGGVDPVEPELDHVGLLAAVDEVLLELQPAVGRVDLGRDGRVRHRQDPGRDPMRRLEPEADLGEPAGRPQPRGPRDVERQVAVAEPEPRLLAVRGQLVHRGVGVALDAPAPGHLLDAREVVQDRVVVGHHEQPVADAVVAGVDDDVEPVPDVGLEPLGQLRAADAAGEGDDPARHLSRPRGGRGSRSRGPGT